MVTRKTHKVRGATVTVLQNRPGTLEERLLRRREITKSGCWVWTGYCARFGYGQISGEGTKKLLSTHRASYITFVGPIPDGMCILHRCDNPPCFNPEHLFIGTHSDNARDKVAKGRDGSLYGESHQFARLTNEQVAEIRSSYVPASRNGRGYKSNAEELANYYGISKGYIRDIISRKWRATS